VALSRPLGHAGEESALQRLEGRLAGVYSPAAGRSHWESQLMLSWMNDSGFWVISELSGFAEQETLKSWTAVRPTISLVGLIVRWIETTVLPLSPP